MRREFPSASIVYGVEMNPVRVIGFPSEVAEDHPHDPAPGGAHGQIRQVGTYRCRLP